MGVVFPEGLRALRGFVTTPLYREGMTTLEVFATVFFVYVIAALGNRIEERAFSRQK